MAPDDRPDEWIEFGHFEPAASIGKAAEHAAGMTASGSGAGADTTGSGERFAEWPPAAADPVDWPALPPTPPPTRRRWLRWAAVGAGIAVIAGGIALQRSGADEDAGRTDTLVDTSVSQPDSTPTADLFTGDRPPPSSNSDPDTLLPTTTALAEPSLFPDADWEVVGYGTDAVLRYLPARSELIRTPLGRSYSSGPLSFVPIGDSVVLRPYDPYPGFLVPDDEPAQPLSGLLADGGPALRSTDPNSLWVVVPEPVGLTTVDVGGNAIGDVVPLPNTPNADIKYQVRPDGAGNVLVTVIDGTYRVDRRGTRLLTHGIVLATGPTNILAYECNDSAECGSVVLNHSTGQRTPLVLTPTVPWSAVDAGVTSPDGTFAALSTGASAVYLVNLHTGATVTANIGANLDAYYGNLTDTLAFTPDGGTLLVSTDSGVIALDTTTGQVRGTLPMPPLRAIAVRPAH